MEHVGTHVVFRPRHGPSSNTETLLHPLRSYLLYQNVHVQFDKDPQLPPKEHEKPYYVMKTEDTSDEHLTDAGKNLFKFTLSVGSLGLSFQYDKISLQP